MHTKKLKISNVRPNPFRNFEDFPLLPQKVEALKRSIQETGFWNNIMGRLVNGVVEIAYGHHRLEAARQVYGDDHEITISVRDLSDIEMLRVMGLENAEDWMNSVQHSLNVVKQARAFFDSWLERFSTWEDFVQGRQETPLPEFGVSADPVKDVAKWLGGASEAPNNYANIVKYGVGTTVLGRFTGLAETTIRRTLETLGPSEREKRMLEVMAEERRAAEAEWERQKAAEEAARRAQIEAERKEREAEIERKRQAMIAQRAVRDEVLRINARLEAEAAAARRDQAKQEREQAERAERESQRIRKEAEKRARAVSEAEKRKRQAAEEQQYYDQQVTLEWSQHTHAVEFRRLCLLPGHLRILSKEKQVEFAGYIKTLITGEPTSEKIRQVFMVEVRDFMSGIRKQQEEDNPLLILKRTLEDWDKKCAALTQQTHRLREIYREQGGLRFEYMTKYDMEGRITQLLYEISQLCIEGGLELNSIPAPQDSKEPPVRLLK